MLRVQLIKLSDWVPDVSSKTGIAFVIAIALLVTSVSGCDELHGILTHIRVADINERVPQLTGVSGEIPIGIALPLSGRFVSEFGYLPTQLGAELALNEINNAQRGDARIAFIIQDDGGTVEGSVEAFNSLIHQHGVPVILGPGLSIQAEKAFPIAQEHQVVAFSATASASGLSAIGDHIFRVSLTNDVLIPSGIKSTQEKLGYQGVALLYDETDLYSADNHELLRDTLVSRGVKVLARETFSGGDDNCSVQFARIDSLNPDAVFVSGLSVDFPKILSQGRASGISDDIPFIVPDLAIDEVRAAGAAAEGTVTFSGWFSTAATPGNLAFVENYRTAFDVEASTWAAHAYATVAYRRVAFATGNRI